MFREHLNSIKFRYEARNGMKAEILRYSNELPGCYIALYEDKKKRELDECGGSLEDVEFDLINVSISIPLKMLSQISLDNWYYQG